MTVYRVVAGSVPAETQIEGGRAIIDHPRGAVLPSDVPEEQVQRLLAFGHIELETADPEPAPAEPETGLSDLDKAELLARAKDLGIPADGRWGVDKLTAAIQEHE